MKFIAVFALAVLSAPSLASAQKVVLSAERLACEGAVRDTRQVSARWLGRNTLEVVAFDDETTDQRVDVKSAWVHFAGAQLRLRTTNGRCSSRPIAAPVRWTWRVCFPSG